jgi:hypothetical protein
VLFTHPIKLLLPKLKSLAKRRNLCLSTLTPLIWHKLKKKKMFLVQQISFDNNYIFNYQIAASKILKAKTERNSYD